jgi:hypothetical protein
MEVIPHQCSEYSGIFCDEDNLITVQVMKSFLKRFAVMITKRSSGSFQKNDYMALRSGFLAIRAFKAGFSTMRPRTYGALVKVRIVSILLAYDTNRFMCTSWVWQNNDRVGSVIIPCHITV